MSRTSRRLARPFFTMLAIALMLAGASQASTMGQLSGFVLDSDGAPLPGASVSASSPSQIGGAQLAQTDPTGWFHYPRLSPGFYTVRVRLDGFLTQEITEVQVRLDRMTELQVTMPLATFGDEVEVVVSTPVVDPEQVSTGQTFTAKYIQEAAVGMENRHYLGVLSQTAGVETAWGTGIVMVMGSSPNDNNFLIDGMDTTDQHVNLFNAQLSVEAVEEIAFHTAGFEAQFGRSTGGVVNLITKSGGNRFRGSVDYRYADSGFETSGDHWDPEEQRSQVSDLNASLGGPLMRDRLWFFAAFENLAEESTPRGAPTTWTYGLQSYFGKLTWQASADWSLVGTFMADPDRTDNANSSQFRTANATRQINRRGLRGQTDLRGVLSDNLLFGARIGFHDGQYEHLPQDGDLTTIGHRNLSTGERYGNWGDQNYGPRGRREIDSDANWFVDNLAGSHDFKGGIRYTSSDYSSNWCYNGSGRPCTAGVEGYFFSDAADEMGKFLPYRMEVNAAIGKQTFDGSIWSTYLQDSWRIRPDLTVKVGLRWDRSRQTNDVGEEIADLAMLQPRIGGAWSLGGRGRNVLRASWGRYMDPLSLEIAQFTTAYSTPFEIWVSCSNDMEVSDPGLCAEIAASEGWGYRTDPENWDPAGWGLAPWRVFQTEPNQTSPDLEPVYTDEWVLGYERELYRRTSFEVSYVRKNTKNVMEDTCNGNLPTPAEGADCSHYVLGNLPGLRKDYEGLIFGVESRAFDWLHLIGSYVLSDSKGTVPYKDATGNFDVYPYHFVNQYGYLWDQSRHRVKLNGFVILPLDFSLAINSWWNSEFRWSPWTRQRPVPYGWMALEPVGSRSEPGEYLLDLQVGKGFRLGPARLRLLGTIYNLLDTEIVIGVCDVDVGCGEFELGDPIAWQQPRSYEVGVRVEF